MACAARGVKACDRRRPSGARAESLRRSLPTRSIASGARAGAWHKVLRALRFAPVTGFACGVPAPQSAAGRRRMALSLQTFRCPAGTRLQARSARRPAARRMAPLSMASVDALQREAVKAFLGDAKVEFAATSGGVNNLVSYVKHGDTTSIVRTYNNGENTARVRFEHAILAELKKVKHQLSFQIPETLPALNGGGSHVQLSNGAQASMFKLIPGTLPKLTCARAIGVATGELTQAMFDIKLDLASPTPAYNMLFEVHHAVSRDKFFAVVSGPDCDGVRDAMDFLVGELRKVENEIEKCHALKLPESWIHGDLHYDNCLVDAGKVSGLLDFEFAARDWRAMELAICLSKYVGEPEPLPYLSEYIAGFAEGGGVLNEAEVGALPALINLRVLSNVVYFVGRALAGEDDITSLTTRAEAYAARVRWVNANGAVLQRALTEAVLKR